MTNVEFKRFLKALEGDRDAVEHCAYLYLTMTPRQVSRCAEWYMLRGLYNVEIGDGEDVVVSFGGPHSNVYKVPLDKVNTYLTDEEKWVPVFTTCPRCNEDELHVVRVIDLYEYQSPNRTRTIQEIFAYLGREEREMFVSGICPICWSEIFGEED